jgi:hypothetical protein
MNFLKKLFRSSVNAAAADKARMLKSAEDRAEVMYMFSSVGTSDFVRKLIAQNRVVKAIKIRIVPLVIGHCLCIEHSRRLGPEAFPVEYFFAMSDYTKHLLTKSDIGSLSPVDAFPSEKTRQGIVSAFYGPECVNLSDAITAVRLLIVDD